MTVDLTDDEAPDSEDFFTCWLQPLLAAGTEHKTDDGFPFAIVQFLTGEDDPDCGTDDGVTQIDVLDTARDGLTAAQNCKLTSRKVHRRMMFMAKHLPDVTLSDGSVANASSVKTEMKFRRMDYTNDKVVRYTAKYSHGMEYVPHVEFPDES